MTKAERDALRHILTLKDVDGYRCDWCDSMNVDHADDCIHRRAVELVREIDGDQK